MLSQRNVEPVDDQAQIEKQSCKLYPWVCNHCGYEILESLDLKRIREVVSHQRQERAKATFSTLEWEDRQKIAQKHKIGSRIFYVVSALTFINFIYMLGTGTPIFIAMNWASFSLMFWVFGMKKAYRTWQVMSDRIFERGAFWHWFKHEKWLI